jgi:hypothetical protein
MPKEEESINMIAIRLSPSALPDISSDQVQHEDLVTRLVLTQIVESKAEEVKPNPSLWIVDYSHSAKKLSEFH